MAASSNAIIRTDRGDYTISELLDAVDLKRNENQSLAGAPPTERVAAAPTFTRLTVAAPLATEATSGGDLYFPQIMKTPDSGGPYAGEPYRLYSSTDHDGGAGGIYLQTAAAPYGPYTDRGLIYQDSGSGGNQTETPWVVWNEKESLYFLYYQQQNPTGTRAFQTTCLATSVNGVDTWTRIGPIMDFTPSLTEHVGIAGSNALHTGYVRPNRIMDRWVAYGLWRGQVSANQGGFAQWWSYDGREWQIHGHELASDMHNLADNNDRRISWNGAQLLLWHGQLMMFVLTSPFVGGAGAGSAEANLVPVSLDLRTILGPPRKLTVGGTRGAWEDPTEDVCIQSLFTENGKIYGVYATATAAIGLAVAT